MTFRDGLGADDRHRLGVELMTELVRAVPADEAAEIEHLINAAYMPGKKETVALRAALILCASPDADDVLRGLHLLEHEARCHHGNWSSNC
jgi:hypothetical protein